MPAKRSRFTASLKLLSLPSTVSVAACLTLTVVSGCRSRAHNDLYQQRMAGEIRVLEDQLYEADYQNRVLREKLERTQGAPQEYAKPSVASPPPPVSDPLSDGIIIDDFEFGHGFDEPLVDPGTSVPPEALAVPVPDSEPDNERLPAPGLPSPPGASDLDPPAIIEGELLPPPRADGQPENPPGQVELPDTAKMLHRKRGYPDQLQIHSGLSGGYQFDEDQELDGLLVVVNVVDDHGQPVNLGDFDLDAELTVVALDPTREPREARVGRWEFSREEVHELVKVHPVSGLHIPILWQEDQPAGEEVIVHVRLKADEEEMRCEQRLRTDKPVESKRIADWTPRGEKIKRGIGESVLVR